MPYWALAKSKDGWRVEFALRESPDILAAAKMQDFFGLRSEKEPISVIDQPKGPHALCLVR